MNIEIVPNHNVAWLENGSELGDHIGVEGLAIDCSIDHPGCYHFITAQGGDECLCVPFAKWCVGDQPLAAQAAAPKRRHVCLHTGLIDEQQTGRRRLDGWQAMLAPYIAIHFDVGAFSFCCQQRFFYS